MVANSRGGRQSDVKLPNRKRRRLRDGTYKRSVAVARARSRQSNNELLKAEVRFVEAAKEAARRNQRRSPRDGTRQRGILSDGISPTREDKEWH